jgi:DNA-binding NtrC family response regulator
VLEFQLRENNYEVLTAADGLTALDLLRSTKSLASSRICVCPASGLELLQRAGAIKADTPVIVITAYGDIETAVERCAPVRSTSSPSHLTASRFS